jgi:hypothetical protein
VGALAAVASPNQHLGPDAHSLKARLLLEPEQEGASTLACLGEDDAPGVIWAPKLLQQDLFQHLQFWVLRTMSRQAGQRILLV